MGFTLSKTTFNLNVFSKTIDLRALGLHKLIVRVEHIFVTRSYLLKKCAKKSVGWTYHFWCRRDKFSRKTKKYRELADFYL